MDNMTPMHVTLEQLKRQCNVDYDDDDDTLLAMGAAAEETVIRMTGRDEGELYDLNYGQFPASLTQAILILAGRFYAEREGGDKSCADVMFLIRPWQQI